MANHKAATEVTVAPLAEKTGLEIIVDKYWKLALGLFFAVAAGILVTQYMGNQSRAAQDAGWGKFGELVSFPDPNRFGSTFEVSDPAALRALANESDLGASPWALAWAAKAFVDAGDMDSARATLNDLKSKFEDHDVLKSGFARDEAGNPVSLVDRVETYMEGMGGLRQELPGLFDNMAPPEGAPRVRLTTTAGDIVVALYEEQAPQHVENFLKRSREGLYDQTKFHRTLAGFMVQGGDPNSIEGERGTWGLGDAGYTIPQEFSDLVHHRGYLAAAKRPDQVESGGAQFYFTVATPYHLDGVHTVFGKIVEGMDVVDDIATRPLLEGTDPQQGQPREPVAITGTTVL